MPRLAPLVALALAIAVAAPPAAAGAPLVYELDLPAGRNIGYRIEFEPSAPGVLRLEAAWSGARVLSVRVDGPPGVGTLGRRSGPSPLTLELEIDPVAARRVGRWQVSVRGLPSRETSRGTLRLALPDPSGTAVATAPGERPVRLEADPRAAAPPRWRRPAPAPSRARTEVVRLHEAIERFRRLVVDDPVPDAYGWQDGLLEYLATRRDRIAGDDPSRDVPSWRAFARLVDAVGQLEALRATDEPLLLEPPPEEDSLRAAWRLVRERRFERHRRLLDELMRDFQERGHVPSLDRAGWPEQLVACLQACRRHFETRHPDEGAVRPHADVVEAQWERVLAGVAAIERLLDARPDVDPPQAP